MAAVVLATLATAFSLGAAEAAVRLFDLGPHITAVNHGNYRLSDNPLLRYELAPGTPDGATTINSDGMRDREFPLATPPHTFRIACIGDSITYGFGVDNPADTYPKRLETLLNAYCATPSIRFEVLNFGVPGYNLNEIVENVRVKVLKYHPDLILYGYCLNDPQQISLEFLKLLGSLTDAEKKYGFQSQMEGFWTARLRLFRLAAYEIQTLTQGHDQTRHRVPASADPENVYLKASAGAAYFTALHNSQEGRQILDNSLDTLAVACAKAHVPVCVFIFPVTNDLNPYSLVDVHRLVAELCKQRAFHVYDLLESFQQYEQLAGQNIYFDYLHPFPRGDHYTAEIMLSMLIQDFLLPQVEQAEVARRLIEGPDEDRQFGQWAHLIPMP